MCNDGITGNGTCGCSPGFAGPACQYSDAVTCSGHGTAQNDGTCICDPAWTGPSCTACSSTDADGDLHPACSDCDDSNASIWSTPSEVLGLLGSHSTLTGVTTLTWQAPVDPGGTTVSYQALRSTTPGDFVSVPFCLIGPDPTILSVTDADAPPLNSAFYYLVRGTNGCPMGVGTLGSGTSGIPREGDCP